MLVWYCGGVCVTYTHMVCLCEDERKMVLFKEYVRSCHVLRSVQKNLLLRLPYTWRGHYVLDGHKKRLVGRSEGSRQTFFCKPHHFGFLLAQTRGLREASHEHVLSARYSHGKSVQIWASDCAVYRKRSVAVAPSYRPGEFCVHVNISVFGCSSSSSVVHGWLMLMSEIAHNSAFFNAQTRARRGASRPGLVTGQ